MKKRLVIFFLIIFFCIPLKIHAVATNSSLFAKNKIYILYTKDCKECKEEKDTLEKKFENDNSINVEYININDNKKLVKEIKKNLKIKTNKLPVTIIGTTYFKGFNNKVINNITKAVKAYAKKDNYCNIVTNINNKDDLKKCLKDNKGIYKNNRVTTILTIIVIIAIICLIIFTIKFKKKRKSTSLDLVIL